MTKDNRFEEILEEVMNDPKSQKILEELGSDYDEDGKAYWEK